MMTALELEQRAQAVRDALDTLKAAVKSATDAGLIVRWNTPSYTLMNVEFIEYVAAIAPIIMGPY